MAAGEFNAIAGFKMEVLSNRFWYRSVASDAKYGFHDPVLPFNEQILFRIGGHQTRLD